jgi:hypothetical protein
MRATHVIASGDDWALIANYKDGIITKFIYRTDWRGHK